LRADDDFATEVSDRAGRRTNGRSMTEEAGWR
jgi:hypothetical protein